MRRRLHLVLAVLGLFAALGGGGFAWFLGAVAAEPEQQERRADAIVVLTGGQERVQTALGLLDAGRAPRLLISGAAPRLTLAELARAHGRDAAALAGRVAIGYAAASTAGNAAETAAWARTQNLGTGATIRVVTAGYHMPRAMIELERAMPGVEFVAHPVGPSALREGGLPWARAARLLVGEYIKFGLALTGLTVLLPAWESSRR